MKFLIFFALAAVVTAQQYSDQEFEIQYRPPQGRADAGRYRQPQQQQQSRQYSAYPQNIPVGYSAEPHQQNGHGNGQARQIPYNNNHQQQSGGPYVPNELSEEFQPKPSQRFTDASEVEKPHTYPLTPPALRYKIGLIADLGEESKTKNGTFKSHLREGHLIVSKLSSDKKTEDSPSHNITVEFKEDMDVQCFESGLNDKGEGMRMSTLNVFHGKLYACDDWAGIVYELVTNTTTGNITANPWVLLSNNGGKDRATFKCEWATVKDDHLWVGSLGVPLDKQGKENPGKLSIRKISREGSVTIVDWSETYEKLSKAAEVEWKTGFVRHEAAAWSPLLQKWVFTPRRVSKTKFDKATTDKTGSNLALWADDHFDKIEAKKLGEVVPASGFVSVKFIPGSQDQLILVLKASGEGKQAFSELAVYDLEGNEIMKPTKVASGFYAGVEFL